MTADTVRLSYSPADDRVADALDADSYRSYLRRAHRGAVEPGTAWSEFVGRGCGVTDDVTLRVESDRRFVDRCGHDVRVRAPHGLRRGP